MFCKQSRVIVESKDKIAVLLYPLVWETQALKGGPLRGRERNREREREEEEE